MKEAEISASPSRALLHGADVAHKRILVASPIEPSGASWLLNCFLELDIRIDHKPVADRVWRGSASPAEAGRIWTGKDGHVALNPKASVLKKFLPALSRRAAFSFRDDVSVEYVQDFPPRILGEHAHVLMVRDPRDAIYSSYRRSTPALSFAEFMAFPNAATLLDRPAHWALFVAAWLAVPGTHIVRFEDYKTDAEATLRAVLTALNLTYGDYEISEAVRLSSFERAREAERAMGDQHTLDRQVANRSGKVGEGRDHKEVQAAVPDIDATAGTVLHKIGYAASALPARDAFAAARMSAAFLSFFQAVHLPEDVASLPVDLAAAGDWLCAVSAFAHRVDTGLLQRAGLPPAEIRTLLDSLTEFTGRHAEWVTHRLQSTRTTFGDGSGYFFQRIRDMRRSGRPAPEPEPN